jgi:hypothetical protein
MQSIVLKLENDCIEGECLMVRTGRGRTFSQKLVTLFIELSMLMILLALVAPQYLKDALLFISSLFDFLP